MSSPYREILETVKREERTPVFRPLEQNVIPCGILAALILLVALPDWLRGRHDSAFVFVAWHLAAFPVGGLICVVERPVRTWLEQRYARKVARGIVELEARASRIGSGHDA